MTVPYGEQAHVLRNWKQISDSGVGIARSVELLESGPYGSEAKAQLGALRGRLRGGGNLAEARATLEALFCGPAVAMLLAGEESGRMKPCLEAALSHVETRIALRRKILLAIAYPLFLTVAAAVLLPVPTLWNEGLLAAILYYYLPMAAAAGCAYGIGRWVVSAWRRGGEGRAAWERRLLRVPVAGRFYQELSGGLFFATLGSLLESGLPLSRALESAAGASGAAVLQERAGAMVSAALGGRPLSEVLAAEPLFAGAALERVRIGEETGDLASACLDLARQYEEALGKRGTHLAILVGCLLALAVATALVLKIVGFWVAYFERGADAGLW